MKAIFTFISMTILFNHISAQDIIWTGIQSPQSDVYRLDSLYHWEWDTSLVNWSLHDRNWYTQDENQHNTSITSAELDSAQQWNNKELTLFTYNVDGKPTLYTDQEWDGSNWVNVSQTIYTYDGNGDQTSVLDQDWVGSEWVNSLQQVFTYDDHHNVLTRLVQLWGGTDWLTGTRQVSSYDGNDRLIMRVNQGWNLDWYDISRSLFVYDANNDLDTLLYQRKFNEWTDDYRNLYDYDDHHNRTLIHEQLAVGINYWEDQSKYEYTYDENDLITHLLHTSFENDTWNNVYQYNVTNEEDHRTTEVFQTWETDWINQDSTQYYYTNLTAIPDISELNMISLAPNPAHDFILMEVPGSIDGMVSIYSITGAKQMEFKARFENLYQLNIGSLLPGQYILALRTANGLVSKVFQKL